ncbi:DUF309 domain-containing protein [Mesobacillus maritimus]|uniref:DUF309 domain-containing protein n=1 Tax=Mesobacillus maritimus TaxID=1643336 RepID=UPI00384E2208
MIPKAFIQYLVHFHGDRDYFECHEVLEEYWKEVDPGNKESIWVGFIQLAVSSYHYRRANFSGALRTHNKSAAILNNHPQKCTELGIDYPELMKLIEERKARVISHQPYRSIHLPIDNQDLLAQCLKECEKQNLVWGEVSDTLDKSLVNKHSMRDRTDVIIERKKAIEERKYKKRQ